jgi:hypothetical protein
LIAVAWCCSTRSSCASGTRASRFMRSSTCFSAQRIQFHPFIQDDAHAREGVVVELADRLADHVFPR